MDHKHLSQKLSALAQRLKPDEFSTSVINWALLIGFTAYFIWYFHTAVFHHFWWGRLVGPLSYMIPSMGCGALGYLLLHKLLFKSLGQYMPLAPSTLLILCLFVPTCIQLMIPVFGLKAAPILLLLVFCIIVSSSQLWSLGYKNKRPLIVLLISSSLIAGYGFLSAKPSVNPHLATYQLDDKTLSLPTPAALGPYQVKQFTYGSGKDLHRSEFGKDIDVITKSVDGSAFVTNWRGIRGALRSLYWGFGPQKMPLQGRVWYPQGDGLFKLVLMVHGNHEMEDYSDEGYDYLGELLASRGYIFVSIDQNFLNLTLAEGIVPHLGWGIYDENDARAWLLLKHLSLWHSWQDSVTHPLAKHIDVSKITLMGHSRGGEAAYTAAYFNQLSAYPDDNNLKFDFNFDIAGVVALAPSDGQYRPNGELVSLTDISYLTLQGSMDGDAVSFMGSSAYSRVSFTGQKSNFKSSVYIHRANHSQFNQVWGRCDSAVVNCWSVDIEQQLGSLQQQKIAQVYLSAFVDVVTGALPDYLPLFTDSAYGAKWLPNTYYVVNFSDAAGQVIANFEEDNEVFSSSIDEQGALAISAEHLTGWNEFTPKLKWEGLDSRVVQLAWDNTQNVVKEDSLPAYHIQLPVNHLDLTENSRLIYSVAVSDDAFVLDGGEQHIDFSIQIQDSQGKLASIKLSELAPLLAPIKHKTKRFKWFNSTPLSEPVFKFYQIKLSELTAGNNTIDINQLVQLSLLFNRTSRGSILLDDIGFIP